MSRDGATAGVPLADAVYVAYQTPDGRGLLSGRLTPARAAQLVASRGPNARIIEADDRAEAFQRAAAEVGSNPWFTGGGGS